ncbi:MAG TPA: ribonuclease P protein component [bacterium]|nr:ribonuclease P protein component [bacterium]HPP86617.1 ribonuclease P protein component [bacterium]
MTPQDYRFRKYHRLHKKKEIKNVFDSGKSIANKNFVIYFKENNLWYSRICIIISKKTIKKSARRNYIRRVIREYFRLNRHRLIAAFDLIFILRKDFELEKYSDIENSLNRLFAHNRLMMVLDKKTDVAKKDN